MKTTVFSVVPDYHYRFDRLPRHEFAGFERAATCGACGEVRDDAVIAALGGQTEADALHLVVCRRCAHVTYDRLPSDKWLDRYYTDVWDQPNRRSPMTTIEVKESTWTPWAFPWRHLDALRIPHTARILEFGCGFGHGIKYLRQLGYNDVYGIEIGSHRAAVASRHFPGRAKQGSTADAEALAARRGLFDLIVLHHVAEHLRDPFDVIRRLAALLSPTGVIVVAVPNMFHECPVFPTLYFPHLHHYNAASLTRLMRRAGVTPVVWTGHDAQLVVAGLGPRAVRPEREYSTEVAQVNDAMVSRIIDFLQAPWRPASAGATQYLCYFHPWYGDGYPAGFQHVAAPMARWITAGRYSCLPLIGRLPNRRGYGAFLRAGRRLFGADALVGTELLGFHQESASNGQVPWLTTAEGDMPVLVK